MFLSLWSNKSQLASAWVHQWAQTTITAQSKSSACYPVTGVRHSVFEILCSEWSNIYPVSTVERVSEFHFVNTVLLIFTIISTTPLQFLNKSGYHLLSNLTDFWTFTTHWVLKGVSGLNCHSKNEDKSGNICRVCTFHVAVFLLK